MRCLVVDISDTTQAASGTTKRMYRLLVQSYSPATKGCSNNWVNGHRADYYTDGTADHSEINTAITAVNTAGGGVVLLKEGTYNISGNINLKSNVRLVGVGLGTIIYQTNSSNIAGSIVNCTSLTNFSIENLKLDANKANNATSGRGITFTDSSYGLLLDVTVTNTVSHSINFRTSSGSCKYNIAQRCSVTESDGSAFIISNGATYNRVIDSTAVNIDFTGFYVTGTGGDSHGNSFINCYAENCDYGFDVYASTNCRVENCRSYLTVRDNFHVEDSYDIEYVSCIGTGSSRDAFAVYSSDLDSKRATDITFSNCTAKGATLNGFHFIGQVISSTTYTAYNMKVFGGIATGNGRYGVQSIYATGINILGVTIEDNGGSTYSGIKIDTSSQNVSILGNTISNNGSYPIELDNSASYVEIGGNDYIGNGGSNLPNYGSASNVSYFGNSGSANKFANQVSVPDDAYTSGWNGNLEVPTKNAVYDQVGLMQAKVFYTVGSTGSGAADYVTDGTADNVEIQAAIDAANTAGGGTVLIKAGVYNLAATITLYSNITLMGEGYATIIKKANSSGIRDIIVNSDVVSGNSNIIIKNLKLDGNKANQASGLSPNGILFGLVNNFLIEGVWAKDVGTVDPLNISEGFAIATGCFDGRVIGCIAEGNAHYGFNCYNASYITFSGNNSVDNGRHGFGCSNGSHNITWSGNTLRGNLNQGFWIRNTYASTIDGNTINMPASSLYGIQLKGNSSEDPNLISDQRNIVTGNTIEGPCTYGVYIQNHSNYNVITGNTISGSSSHGVYVISTECNTIVNNSILNCTESGVYLDAITSVTVSSNFCKLNGTHGIFAIAFDSVITGNTCVDNSVTTSGGANGITISGRGRNIINDNKCSDSRTPKLQGYGLVERNGTDSNVVTSNQLQSNLLGNLVVMGASSVSANNIGTTASVHFITVSDSITLTEAKSLVKT
jgi:parallel beta-helix repeat protein